MSVQEKSRWKKWADQLRQEMMMSRTPEITKTITEISSETGTTKAHSTLVGTRFWTSCQQGVAPNDVLVIAGFEVAFALGQDSKVAAVTLKLNRTWMDILQRAAAKKRSQ
jgi:hypothetical protein